MTIHTPQPLIDPLLRTILRMPPTLSRFAKESGARPLRTVLLRDTPLVQGLHATFDDTCRVTVVDGDQGRLDNVKLTVPANRKELSGIHLAILTTLGQITLAVAGNDARVFIGVGCNIRASIQLSNQPTLFIGDGTTMAQARLLVTVADMVVGNDCQFQEELVVQCSDAHPITDLDTGEVINGQRRQVNIGRHVWLGRRVLVLPDARIGEGSIVESGAVVSGTLPAHVLAGGSPAVVLRSKVGWSREFGKPPPVFSVKE